MKKTHLLISMLSVSLFFASCTKDEEIFENQETTNSEEPATGSSVDAYTANKRLTDGTSKKWKWVKHEQNGKSVTIPSCDLSSSYEFFADGMRTVAVKDSTCNKHVVTPQQVYSSRWSLLGSDSLKIESGTSNSAAYRIKELTDDKLSLETQIVVSDSTGAVTNTIKLIDTFTAEVAAQ